MKLPKCQYNYESDYPKIKFTCNEPSITNRKFCIFHDEEHYAEHEQEAAKRFEMKVSENIFKNKPLECIGYYLPGINFANLIRDETFPQPVYFDEAAFYKEVNFSKVKFSEIASFAGAKFFKEANFSNATFCDRANFQGAAFSEIADFVGAAFTQRADFAGAKFSEIASFDSANFSERADFAGAKFSEIASFVAAQFSKEAAFSAAHFVAEAYFVRCEFGDKTFLRYTLFEQPNKVVFDDNNLSKVSFADSDITRIRFGDKITWGGKDGFTIIEEEWLKEIAKLQYGLKKAYTFAGGDVSLELALSVYRNLRENYEFRLRYNDAGKFFIKEMELKRKYREIDRRDVKKNGWLRRQFSLTGLYYHLSKYGESISRPAIIAMITVILSTLLWVTQGNPILEPHFDSTQTTNSTYSTFVGFEKAGNTTQWLKGFERSLADFLPLLSLGGKTEVGIFDYFIKIFGGGLTLVLLAVALRRKFERKFTR